MGGSQVPCLPRILEPLAPILTPCSEAATSSYPEGKLPLVSDRKKTKAEVLVKVVIPGPVAG